MSYPTSTCQNCSTPYRPRRWDQRFCSDHCKNEATNLEQLRGRQLYALAMRWRCDRGNAKEYLKGLCRLIAKFREEDVRAGRPLPYLYPEQVAQMDGFKPKPKGIDPKGRKLYAETQTPYGDPLR